MTIPTEALRKSIGASADLARLWFEDRTQRKYREQFLKKGGLSDTGDGAVYAYFLPDNHALYVGETGRNVKARLHDQTSPHKSKPWWKQWMTMRFIQLEDDMDRLVLEFLLILAYKPEFNEKPRAKNLNELWIQVPASGNAL